MSRLLATLTFVSLATGLCSGQYHRQIFIVGGYGYTTSTLYQPGLFLLDGAQQKVTSLLPAWARAGSIHDACMDADNRSIVFISGSTTSTVYNVANGIFRLDPSTGVIQTIVLNNFPNDGPMLVQNRIMVDQDGHYVFGAVDQKTVPPFRIENHHILKVDASSLMTTVFTSQMLGGVDYAYFHGVIGRDIDTGDFLVNSRTMNSSRHSKLGNCGWIQIDPHITGKWSTFFGGPGGYGKPIDFTTTNQDYATGQIHEFSGKILEFPDSRLLAHARGGHKFTTIWNFGYPGMWTYSANGIRDLQSAPTKRWCAPGYFQRSDAARNHHWFSPAYAKLDATPPFQTRVVDCDPHDKHRTRYGVTHSFSRTWTFFRGRNIQTIKAGPGQWQIRFSCPWYPNGRYVAVVGAAGIRPGIPLPSGRTVWLNIDKLVELSLKNRLRPFFDPGPGKLDAAGEATGYLNLRSLPMLGGRPIWIALAVLDPTAPDGIAFLPDTYVMKLP